MQFEAELFRNYMSGTVLDELLCSYKGLPKGVNYMIIGAPDQLKRMKASMSVWELYNAVTDYASNNSVWDKDDNRRGMLQGEALRFLMRERDVKNYSDIFS